MQIKVILFRGVRVPVVRPWIIHSLDDIVSHALARTFRSQKEGVIVVDVRYIEGGDMILQELSHLIRRIDELDHLIQSLRPSRQRD